MGRAASADLAGGPARHHSRAARRARADRARRRGAHRHRAGWIRAHESAEVDVASAAQGPAARRGRCSPPVSSARQRRRPSPAAGCSGAGCWPGEDQPWLAAHRRLIDQTRFDSLRIVAQAASGLNQHARAIDAARLAVELDPLNERAHQVLISALDRAGDRAGAVTRLRAMPDRSG